VGFLIILDINIYVPGFSTVTLEFQAHVHRE